MIDFHSTTLQKLNIHKVGNKLREEGITFFEDEMDFNEETKKFLMSFFLNPFKGDGFFEFTHPLGDIASNDAFRIVSSIFDNSDGFAQSAKDLATLLYHNSLHPKIKGGDLYAALFSNCNLDGKNVEAIGLFKAELKDVILRNSESKVWHESGTNISKMDKGCLIFNSDREGGYRLLIVDSIRDSNSKYWQDDFLGVKPSQDEFHLTSDFLSMTKNYVSNQLPKEMEFEKTDQVDLLSRSVSFFKENETFDNEKFMEEVFQEPELISSFQQFQDSQATQNERSFPNQFDISESAVKKKSRNFKSVLKLDKNFHVYIHGNRELIERGVDPDTGKKFYKIYFDEEH